MASELVYESATLIAFYHPNPSHTFHILIVPKKAVSDLQEFNPIDHNQFLIELFQLVRNLVKRFNLEPYGYRLIVNGGKYQIIPQLHFHLVSDDFIGSAEQA